MKELQERFEINVFDRGSYSQGIRCFDGKEAWKKYVTELEKYPLYRVWFVSIKKTVVDKPKAL